MKQHRYAAIAVAMLSIAAVEFNMTVPCLAQSKPPYAYDKPLTEPVMFGEGVISTAEDELNACFAPDGKTIYFSLNAPVNRLGVIVFSRFENGKWRTPQVAPFSGQYSDYDPFISPDGNKLFFISNRPADNNPKKDYDIWVVEKTNGGWNAPKNLSAPINNDADQFYPSVAANGTLYFSTIKREEKSGFDLYRSKFVDGKYAEPEKLSDAVNSQFAEIDACIAPDESFIVFASYNRPEEYGRGDLYISFNQNGVWTPAKNLGEKINSNAREYCPILSPDGKYFFFTSFRGFADKPPEKPLNYEQLLRNLRSPRNGMGNIYQIDVEALHAQRQTSGL
ncbi:MAG: hypothetical protein ACRENG_02170 [bacterium]